MTDVYYGATEVEWKSIEVGSNEMKVNSEIKTLDVPAMIVGGRTMVPARAIAEAFGCTVGWDGENRVVTIE